MWLVGSELQMVATHAAVALLTGVQPVEADPL